MTVCSILAAAFSLSLCSVAFSETPSREKAQVLLEEVKKRDLEGRITAKQTELQRLNEDLSKREKDAADLQQSIDSISSAIGEASGVLERLEFEKGRLVRVLQLTSQRIEAEKSKVDGLRTLSDAQAKTRVSVSKQIEETTIRNGIGSAELKVLTQKQASQKGDDTPKEDEAKVFSEIADLKKKLVRSERSAASAKKLARDAMSAASEKLLQADSADLKAKKTASELGLDEKGSATDAKAPLEPIAQPPSPRDPR